MASEHSHVVHDLEGGALPLVGLREQDEEFFRARDFILSVKTRFLAEADRTTYKAFLRVLHDFQLEQRSFPDVLERVLALFEGQDDLVEGFIYFLPDAVQGDARRRVRHVRQERADRWYAATSPIRCDRRKRSACDILSPLRMDVGHCKASKIKASAPRFFPDKELLECTACLEFFVPLPGNPQTALGPSGFPCHHVFCPSCLQAMNTSLGRLQCPECKSRAFIPPFQGPLPSLSSSPFILYPCYSTHHHSAPPSPLGQDNSQLEA